MPCLELYQKFLLEDVERFVNSEVDVWICVMWQAEGLMLSILGS